MEKENRFIKLSRKDVSEGIERKGQLDFLSWSVAWTKLCEDYPDSTYYFGETQTFEDLRWSAWAADSEGLTGDKLLDFANDTLFPALKDMEVGPRIEGDDAVSRASQALRRRRLARARRGPVFGARRTTTSSTTSSTTSPRTNT